MSDSAAPSGPHHPASRLRLNLRRCTYDGLTATPIVFISGPGNFLVAYLLTELFPMGDTFFGTVVSLTSWFNVLQIVLATWMRTRWTPKSVSLAFCWMQAATWLVLAVSLPFVPEESTEIAQRLFFALFALSALSSSMAGVMWNAWVQEWIPQRIRGKYFGFRNSLLALVNIAFLLGVGEVLAAFPKEQGVLGFQIVVGGAVVLRVISNLFQHGIHGPSQHGHISSSTGWREQFAVLRKAKPFLWTVGFGVLWTACTSIFGPFFMRFMLDGLKMSPSEVTTLLIINSVTGALSLPAWGQMLDRYGCRPVLITCLACWLVPSFGWYFMTPESHGYLKWMWASGGVFGGGFVLAHFTLLLKVVPQEARTLAISFNVALAAMIGAIGPIFGGWLIEHLKRSGFQALSVYQVLSVFHHLLPLSCILVVRRIQEPRSATLTQLFGAMRSARAIAGLMGMTFLQNHVFVRRKR